MATYLIIGASSGIGKQLAHQLVKAGHVVIGTWYKKDMSAENSPVLFHYLNVLDEKMNFSFLPESINGIIYCPGSINLRSFARILPADFTSDFNLQVTGAVKVIQQVLPKLNNADNASIILFSTVAVQSGLPFHTQVAASMSAVEGLTKVLAVELSAKIRVYCSSPFLVVLSEYG